VGVLTVMLLMVDVGAGTVLHPVEPGAFAA
jgi:hypothetical protein